MVTLRNSVSVVTHMGLGRGLRHLSSAIFSFDASVQKSMSTDIDARTLRGVRADQAMSCFGARLARGSVGSGHGRVVAKQVLSLDDFISHDWRTHHRAKFLSLCILFNARAAALGSLFVGMTKLGTQDVSQFTVGIILHCLQDNGYGELPGELGQEALDNYFDMRQGKAESIQDYIFREEILTVALQKDRAIDLDEKI